MSSSGTLSTEKDAEQMVFGAIDNLCKSEEQSYDDFLKCFRFLKKEDVKNPSTLKNDKYDQYLHDLLENDPDKTGEEPPKVLPKNRTEEELKEEVLTMGESQFGKAPPAMGEVKVKMDNFIEDEELRCSGDDDLGSGYSPSITEPKEEQPLAKVNQNLTTSTDLNGESLQNFPNGEGHDLMTNRGQPEIKESGADRNKDVSTCEPSKLLLDIGLKYQQWQEYANEISSDEENGINDEISRKQGDNNMLLPGEVEEVAAPGSLASLDRVTQLDMSMKSATIEEPTAKSPEASRESAEISTEKERSAESADIQQEEEFWEDSIEAFSLDSDFDYDNVTLTPKWQGEHRPPGWPIGQ